MKAINCNSFFLSLLTQLFATCIAVPTKWNIEANNQSVDSVRSVRTYNLHSLAVNQLLRSKRSDAIPATTHEELPERVTSVRCKALSSKSIRIHWNASKNIENIDSVLGYYIGHRVYDSDEPYYYNTVDTNSDKPLEFILKNLNPLISYEIIVQAFNSKGVGPFAAVSCRTLDGQPTRMNVTLISLTSTSAEPKWDVVKEANAVREFRLYLRQEYNDWNLYETLNDTSVTSYTLQSLKCATKYEIYLAAFNEFGDSDYNDMLTFRTKGSAPVAPDKDSFMSINTTFAVLHLNIWTNNWTNSCPIHYFVIQFKQQGDNQWILYSNNVRSSLENIVIDGLQPGNSYDLLITAVSDAGSTEARYLFDTVDEKEETVTSQSISTTQEDNRKPIQPNSCDKINSDFNIFQISFLFSSLI